jgi:DNA-binding NtrC family response regulator
MRGNLNGQLSQIVGELVRHGVTLEQARKEFEKQYIVATLKDHDGNFSRSAKTLGVHRNTLRNKVSNLGIEGRDYSAPRPRPRPRRG